MRDPGCSVCSRSSCCPKRPMGLALQGRLFGFLVLFPGLGDQGLENMTTVVHIGRSLLGMPLQSNHPLLLGVLNRFDAVIVRIGRHGQPSTRGFHGLMVGATNTDGSRSAQNLGDLSIGHQLDLLVHESHVALPKSTR